MLPLIALITTVAAASGSSVCRPGAVWHVDDITVCKCGPDGRTPLCDTRLTDRQFSERAEAVQDEHADCRAGQTWQQHCSQCQCVADGLWFCQFKGCGQVPDGAASDGGLLQPVMYEQPQKLEPVPYEQRQKLEPVPYEQRQKLEPVPYQGQTLEPVPYQNGLEEQECTPGDTYKKDCNECWCTQRGFEACTMMACIDGSGNGGN